MRIGTAVKMTVRNLRIREDTAKYLRNLDPNSAFYDPKTRSMRDDPTPHIPKAEKSYAGDNFIRGGGGTTDMANSQLFAWNAYNHGKDSAHLQANPTAVAIAQKAHKEGAQRRKVGKQRKILDRYGGGEHLMGSSALVQAADAQLQEQEGEAGNGTTQARGSGSGSAVAAAVAGKKGLALPRELLRGVTEGYVEYARDGRVIKGQEKMVTRSKYENGAYDVLTNNHTEVWGSYFDKSTMQWGYGCCHSTVNSSYCTGKAGRIAKAASEQVLPIREMLPPKSVTNALGKGGELRDSEKNPLAAMKSLYGEADTNEAKKFDPDRLKAALAREDARLVREKEKEGKSSSSKSKKGRGSKKKSKRKRSKRSKSDNEDGESGSDGYGGENDYSGDSGESDDDNGRSTKAKRKYNSLEDVDTTAEDMEAYRMKRRREDDPSLDDSKLGDDGLLPLNQ